MRILLTLFTCTLLLTSWAICLTLDLTLEDQLRQLRKDVLTFKKDLVAVVEENVNELKEKLKNLTTEITQLKEDAVGLKRESMQLKNRVSRLESRGLRQQWQLSILMKGHSTLISSANDIEINTELLPVSGKGNGLPRTCQEIIDENPFSVSGQYWIDPIQSVGVGPIYVDCVMNNRTSTGTTVISHDSELRTEADNSCSGPGCYSKEINYNASLQQLQALADLSMECHQYFKYDCIESPFEFGGDQFAWWNDRTGNPQYYWAKDYTTEHRCECGIYGNSNCAADGFKCNCDAGLSRQETDDGLITSKNNLPVTKLNFGFPDPGGYGEHTLGKFECSGKIGLTGIPTSCYELWILGNSINGIFLIKGSKQVETVYCDFSKLPASQSVIGSVDIKSTPVYFYAQKNTDFNQVYPSRIPFELPRLNIGGALDLSSGTFTAPRPGRYFFLFSGVSVLGSKGGALDVSLYLNGAEIGRGETNTWNGEWDPNVLHSVLTLNRGDQVWLSITYLLNSYLRDDSRYHYSHFTGWLLEEDVFSS